MLCCNVCLCGVAENVFVFCRFVLDREKTINLHYPVESG